MVPVSALDDSQTSSDDAGKDAGNGPVRLFCVKYIFITESASIGIVPIKRLELRSRYVNCVNWEKVDGMVPVKLFRKKTISSTRWV